jgi:5-methylcytosine-specific restriction endonuclease McrA
MKKSKKQKLKEECVSLAMKIYLIENPKCEICGMPAETVHHFIRQSRSNHLRCDKKNLVAICNKCHARIHIGQEEAIITLQIRKRRGATWEKYILINKQIKIKDDMFYWKKKKILLEAELAGLIVAY